MRKREIERIAYERINDHRRVADELRELYIGEINRNKKLQNENGYLKALFDKEGDTQVIKYNGKLYRIVGTSHCHDEGEADTLDINAVCVGEVG